MQGRTGGNDVVSQRKVDKTQDEMMKREKMQKNKGNVVLKYTS
jgi:hypothetical protein